MRKRPDSPMWQYLESVGVLEKGTDEEIKAAKKTYRKKYFIQYKKKQRSDKPEYTVNFSKENGEHERVVLSAQKHNMKTSSFLRVATLAYLQRSYIVPNRHQIAQLERLLSDCLNEIKGMTKVKEKFFWQREEKLEHVEKRIIKLEEQIWELFRNPPECPHHDHQNKVT